MKINRTLWTIQGVLAILFVFAGVTKLVLPIEAMAGPVALPGLFLRFLGVAEVLGGVGLVLPGLLNIRPVLTPIAASALVIIMAGAVVITAVGGGVAAAVFPLMVGVALSAVAYGRGVVAL
jgi:DoxX-like protein